MPIAAAIARSEYTERTGERDGGITYVRSKRVEERKRERDTDIESKRARERERERERHV